MTSEKVVYVYASDQSGSTRGVENYHQYGRSLLEEFNKISASHERVYLVWTHECWQSDVGKLREVYSQYDGSGGTSPDSICEWLTRSKYKDFDIYLYLLTDGEIGRDCVDSIIELNRNLSIKKTNFYAFNKNEFSINLSVCSGFMIEAVDIYKNKVLVKEWRKGSQTFNFESMSESYEKFEEQAEALCEYIKFDFMNLNPNDSETVKTIASIKDLKRKMMSLLDDKKTKGEVQEELYSFKKSLSREELLTRISALKDNFVSNCSNQKKAKVELVLNKCLSYLESSQRSYAFNELKFSEISVPENASLLDIEDSDLLSVKYSEQIDIEDVIYLETNHDVPVVSLEVCDLFKAFNASNSFSKFKKLMSCPVGDDKLNEFMLSRNYHAYALKTFIELRRNSRDRYMTDPQTRQHIAGGIVLSGAYDRYNDSIIYAAFFSSRKLINLNFPLFYWLLYKTLKSKSYIEEKVAGKCKEYALHRMSVNNCNLGLIKINEQDLDFKAKVWVALFYVAEVSSRMFGNDDEHFLLERMRLFNSPKTVSEILEILPHFVSVDEAFVRKRAEIMNTCTTLHSFGSLKEKKYFLVEKLFKKSEKYGFFITSLNNENEDFKCLNYLNVDFKVKKVDEDELNKEVSPELINSVVHFTYCFAGEISDDKWKLCETTLRPHFVIDYNLPWYENFTKLAKLPFVSDSKEISYQPVDAVSFDRIVSLHKLCGDFLKSVPIPSISPSDFGKFVYKRKNYSVNLKKFLIFDDRIDELILLTYQNYIMLYMKLELNQEKLRKMLDSSVKRFDRIAQENNVNKLVQYDASNEDKKISLFLTDCDSKFKKLQVTESPANPGSKTSAPVKSAKAPQRGNSSTRTPRRRDNSTRTNRRAHKGAGAVRGRTS